MEAELIRRAIGGDAAAFGQLIEMNYDFIHATAWKWTRSRVDAEDIAQEVCVRLAGAIGSFRGEGRFRTWLYTLVLNAVRDDARKAVRDRRRMDAWISDAGLQTPQSDEDAMQELWTAVQTLPPRQRDCIMLVYSEGLDHADAAEVLGCSESTVSWHLHEGRKRLRIILRRELA